MNQRELERLDKAIYPTPARKRNLKRIVCYALLAATVIAVPGIANAKLDNNGDFFKLNNPGDPNFNQLLGIDDHEIIVGYFGDGMGGPGSIFNNGYVLVPNTHYSVENFAGTPPAGHTITQTQAIGINNKKVPVIVGFWADQNGLQFGFEDVKGVFTTILDPNATAGSTNQNLLGVNDSDEAAGFWVDANNNEHGFIVSLDSSPPQFIEISPTLFNGAVATQASGINDKDQVCGFWADKNGIDHGFFGPLGGNLRSFEVRIENGPRAKSTQALGCSNNFIVGSYVKSDGTTHGFVFDGSDFDSFNAPGSSQTAAFNVAGTIINGVNDEGDIVGFFSDGTNVNGFVRFVTSGGPPESR